MLITSPRTFLLRGLSILLIIFSFGIDFQADRRAQASDAISSDETRSTNDVFVGRVYFSNLEELGYLTSRLDVWKVDHQAGYLVALLSPAEWQSLTQAGYRVEVDEERTQSLYQNNPPLPQGNIRFQIQSGKSKFEIIDAKVTEAGE